MTTCLAYFREHILSVDHTDEPDRKLTATPEELHLAWMYLDSMLNRDSNARDDSTYGSILDEMPLDSTCGDSCKQAIDNAANLIHDLRMAFGLDEHNLDLIDDVATAAVRACLCFIRG